MSKNDTRQSRFERLRSGLEEGIRFARGELALRTTVLPGKPPELLARDVLALRHRLSMSQGFFARTLNVSAKTVQSWEQGSRKPSQAALRLLQILDQKPEILSQLVSAPTARNQKGQRARPKTTA
jgi:putative transcriptional regulator